MSEWKVPEHFHFNAHNIRWGKMGSGSPVVLMHGTPFSSYEWHHIAPALAENYTVYFHDMLGYGQSDMPIGSDVSLGVQNDLIAALLEYWELDHPDVVAHDFGGTTALRAHLLNECEYNSLTLIDPVAVRPWGSPLVQHVKNHEEAFALMPAYMHEAILPAYVRSAAFKPISDEDLEPYLAPWKGENGQKAFYQQIAQMDQTYTDEVQDKYVDLRCPVQVLWGKEDKWIPINKGQELAGLLPNSKFISVPDSGHLMQEDAPSIIIDSVINFLKENKN